MGRNMLKPEVTMRSMPVLYSLWYIYYITWLQRNGRFAPFLIPTLAADADEDLVCAVVDVPVVATSWFEGHIAVALHGLLFGREILGLYRCKMTVAREILGKMGVRTALRPVAMASICGIVRLGKTIL